MSSKTGWRALAVKTVICLLLLLPVGCGKIILVPSPQKQIQQAIDANDTIPAFHDVIYDQYARPMAEVIPALKCFLTHPDPWVRFQAAEDLYIAGDNSGCNVLIDILKTDHPVRGDGGRELRAAAGQILMKYREKRAVNDVINYIRRTTDFSAKNENMAVFFGLIRMMKGSLPGDLVKNTNHLQNRNPEFICFQLLIQKKLKLWRLKGFKIPKSKKAVNKHRKSCRLG